LCLWAVWILFTLSLNPQELAAGAVVSVLVGYLTSSFLFKNKPLKQLKLSKLLYGLAYLPAYLWAEIKSHLKVIMFALHPRMPIRPGIVKVPTDLKSDFGITGLADAITMTPGTLSVDVKEDEPALFVHWIDVKTTGPENTKKEIAEPFEKYLRRIFE